MSNDGVSKLEFNKAMSEQAADRAIWEAEREALESNLAALKNPKHTPIATSTYMFDERDRLREELTNSVLASAKRDAISRFPISALTPELLVGDTPEEIMLSAAELSQRLGHFDYSGVVKSLLNGKVVDSEV